MSVPAGWTVRPLRCVAEVRVSNVDKKIEPGERPVKLCNYMDVYTHEYINAGFDFMEGSASGAEINRFGLRQGDVIITKDSETPDDIGVAAVLTEAADDLVCGYHLALIRPDEDEVDSVYLAKQIGTSRVRRYFAVHATGSTRFGLAVSTIETLSIPTPPRREQAKIADVLLCIDRAIDQTAGLVAKHRRIKAGLVQDLLARGIDEHGKVRSEKTHKFKDSVLGRIPVEWGVKTLSECVEFLDSKRVPLKQDDRDRMEGEYPYYGASGVIDYIDRFLFDDDLILLGEDGENIVSRQAPLAFYVTGKVWVNNHAHVLKPRPNVDLAFLTELLEHQDYSLLVSGSAQPKLSQRHLRAMELAVPETSEQIRMGQVVKASEDCLERTENGLAKLRSMKAGLMQDLLTGRRRVTPLIEKQVLGATA